MSPCLQRIARSYGPSDSPRHNEGVSPHVRLLAVAALPLLALALAGVVWAGLRSRPSAGSGSSTAALIAPRFSRPPPLAPRVLWSGSIPGPLDVTWRRAAADYAIALDELRAYPIVINFWASGCDPCGREAPELERAWRAQRGRVLLLGVNQNDSATDARAFIRRFGITYPGVRDFGDATAIRWGVGGGPVDVLRRRRRTRRGADDRAAASGGRCGAASPRRAREGSDAAWTPTCGHQRAGRGRCVRPPDRARAQPSLPARGSWSPSATRTGSPCSTRGRADMWSGASGGPPEHTT